MSKVVIDHTQHMSPAQLQGVIDDIDTGFGTSRAVIIDLLTAYREILVKAYINNLNESDPEFWTGRRKVVFRRGPFLRS